MINIHTLLEISARRHAHLCPRQVLGVRLGLAGADALKIDIPQKAKRLITILETDGCFADGVEIATGCTVGHRTLRVEDYGKVAATFVDTKHNRAVRVVPKLDIRDKAHQITPHQERRYFAQLEAYQVMPIEELVSIEEVILTTPINEIISRAGVRVNCEFCGEEIINGREIIHEEITLCKPCAGNSYYQMRRQAEPVFLWSDIVQDTALI
jgi:formylmethanofuran dehydrogenase subunit E